MDVRYKRINDVIYAGIKPFRGRTKWVSMKTKDMAIARQRAKEAKLTKLQALENADALTSLAYAKIKGLERVTVSDAIDKFIEELGIRGRSPNTIGITRSMLLLWMRTFGVGGKSTTDIQPSDFRAFFNPGDATKLKTLQQRQYCCAAFCEYCTHMGWMNANHAKACGIDTSKLTQAELLTSSHKPFTKEEFLKVLAVVKGEPFWYLACLIAWEHGLRISDICLLEKVSVANEHLRLVTRKSGTYINLPLAGDIVSAINDKSADGEGQFMFPAERAEYICYGASAFSQRFRNILSRAGVSGKSFHSFRSAFINRTYAERSEDILYRLTQELAKRDTALAAGHSSTQSTDIYLRAGQQTNHEQPERPQGQGGQDHAGDGGPLAKEEHAQPPSS